MGADNMLTLNPEKRNQSPLQRIVKQKQMMYNCETGGSERRSPDGTEVSAVLKPGHHTSSAAAHLLADCVQCSEDKKITNPQAAFNYISKQSAALKITSDINVELFDISMDCSELDVNIVAVDNHLEHTDLSEEIEVDSSCDLKIEGTPEHFLTDDQLHDKGWI